MHDVQVVNVKSFLVSSVDGFCLGSCSNFSGLFVSFCEFITHVALIAWRSAYGMPINEVDALVIGVMSLVVDFVVYELVPVAAESRRLLPTPPLHRWSRCLPRSPAPYCSQSSYCRSDKRLYGAFSIENYAE